MTLKEFLAERRRLTKERPDGTTYELLLDIIEMQDAALERLINPSGIVHTVYPRCYCDNCKSPKELAEAVRERVAAMLKEKT